jgi:hypothetical protein
MTTQIRLLAGAFQLLLVSASAAAHEYEPPPAEDGPFRSHMEASIAAQFAAAVAGDRCSREQSDVVGCTSIAMFAFDFAARLRIAPQWSLGGLAQFGKHSATALIRIGAEGRFHALGSKPVDLSFGVDAGAAFLLDNVPTSELGEAESFTTSAPAFGASAGLDFALSENVSFGLLVRLLLLPMGTSAESFERRPSYDTQLLLSAGLSAGYRWI